MTRRGLASLIPFGVASAVSAETKSNKPKVHYDESKLMFMEHRILWLEIHEAQVKRDQALAAYREICHDYPVDSAKSIKSKASIKRLVATYDESIEYLMKQQQEVMEQLLAYYRQAEAQ